MIVLYSETKCLTFEDKEYEIREKLKRFLKKKKKKTPPPERAEIPKIAIARGPVFLRFSPSQVEPTFEPTKWGATINVLSQIQLMT